jgi:hypothetical protein
MISEVIMNAEGSIEEYEKMWAEDCKIDETNLVREASRIPILHSKYYKLYHRAALKATKLRYELKELEGRKHDWMEGLMDQQDLNKLGWRAYGPKPMKSEIPRKIETDLDVVKLSLKIEYQSSIAKFLEDVVRQINNRNYVIRNMVDLIRFQAGAN